MLRSTKFTIALISAFACFFLAPLYFNLGEPPAGRPQNKCNKHITDPSNDPRKIPRPNDDLKIIRLTNSGEFVDRCELTNALYELNWDRPRPTSAFGVTVGNGAAHLPKLVVLYVHGWKHNADQSDTDRANFERLVQILRSREGGKRYVVGIFVGWNADAPLWGWLENVTFWVKKNNADRIAQSASVTQIYSAIGAIINSDPEHKDQFIAIGHSFGARILFSATAQALVSAVEQAHPGYPGGTYQAIHGLSDAIVLLNPAFEASRYSSLNRLIRDEEAFADAQAPLMITISSEGDWATKTAFPIGQWLGLSRTARELHTLGNYAPFWTHRLEKKRCSGTSHGDVTEVYEAVGLCLQRVNAVTPDNIDLFGPQQSKHNPFIVARTTAEIIRDHNDIWNPTFRDWLVELLADLQRLHEVERQERGVPGVLPRPK